MNNDAAFEDNEFIFVLRGIDVLGVAQEKGLATDLSDSELHVFAKCVESGLSCWSEVVELALMAATSERSR